MTKVEELYDKKVECSSCKREFTTKKVRTSKLRLIKRDSDFLPYYEGENPIKYNVFVCPYCGYAAMENKFKDISYEGRNIISENISLEWNERSFSGKRSIENAIEAYKLALYCGKLLDFKRYDLGSICLRLGWFYRVKEDEQEEQRFLKLAKELYSEAYYKESLTKQDMDELALSYLLGELSRRLGEEEKALNWFNTVLRNPKIKNSRVIENMTREQWQLIREA